MTCLKRNFYVYLISMHLCVKVELRKKSPRPWISNEILVGLLIRQRNEQKKKAKKSVAMDDWKSYKHL